jgi:hypothetical protein
MPHSGAETVLFSQPSSSHRAAFLAYLSKPLTCSQALLPEPIKKIALTHMAINLTAVVLYVNIWLRANGPTGMNASMSAPVLLSIIGAAHSLYQAGLAAKWCMSMA